MNRVKLFSGTYNVTVDEDLKEFEDGINKWLGSIGDSIEITKTVLGQSSTQCVGVVDNVLMIFYHY